MSEPGERPGARLVGPLALVVVGVTTLVAALAAATVDVFDPDVWWMGAAGRHLLEGGGVPRENLFSFTAPTHPWVMHEWGLAPLYAGLLSLGPGWLDLLALVAVVGVVGLVLVGTVGRAERPVAGLLLAVLFCPFVLHMVSPRATVVARLLPAAMALLAFSPRFGRGHVVAAVALEALWANVHGSFPAGVVLLAVAALEPGDAVARRLRLLAAGGAAAVTLANPYGLDLHRLVVAYVAGTDPTVALVRAHVVEFGPITRLLEGDDPPWLELAALATLALLCLVALARPRERARGALALLWIGMACVSHRHLTLAAVLAVLLLVPTADRLAARLPAEVARGFGLRATLLTVLLPAALGGAVALAHALATRPSADRPAARVGGRPVAALVEALPDGAHVLAPFSVAGRVIWRAAPRGVRVFYDSRNDCYPPEVARAAFTLAQPSLTEPEAHAILDAHDVGHVLTSPRDPLAPFVATHGRFRRVAERDGWALWASDHVHRGAGGGVEPVDE